MLMKKITSLVGSLLRMTQRKRRGYVQETLERFAMGKENMQEVTGGSLPEPHGLCHISEVLDFIFNSNKKD